MKQRKKGFTLVEIMIVLAIVGMLSAIAYPSYTQYVIRSKRADAMSALMGAVQAMERYRGNNYNYSVASLATVFAIQVPVEGGTAYYDLTLSNSTATTYLITATPTGTMTGQDGALSVSNTGARTWGAKACWPEGGNDCT